MPARSRDVTGDGRLTERVRFLRAELVTPFSGGSANAWVICLSNALLCGAYGVMWGGSRSFEGRRVRAPLIVAGAAIWIAAFQFESFYELPALRVSLVSTILAAYALLSARELWHARDRELISRWPTLALVVTHAGFLLARIPFASFVASSAAAGQPHSAVVLVMAAEALLVNFCLPFLRVAMSKERAELEQRKAALTDSLTGALLGAAPPLVIYAFLMDYYIAGLTAGATKG